MATTIQERQLQRELKKWMKDTLFLDAVVTESNFYWIDGAINATVLAYEACGELNHPEWFDDKDHIVWELAREASVRFVHLYDYA